MTKKMIPLLIIILGSLLTIGGAFYDYKQKIKEKQDQIDAEIQRNQEYQNLLGKSNDIIEKSNNIISTQQIVIDTSNKIIDLQNQLDEKNDKIQELQNSTLNNVTGGKGVPYLELGLGGTKFVILNIANKSSFPIRLLSIELTLIDADKLKANVIPGFRTDWHYDVGDVSVNTNKTLLYQQIENPSNNVTYYYTVRWLNGYYFGKVIIKNGLQDDYSITENTITEYNKSFNVFHKVTINNKFAEIKH